ncbi:K(+)/H(+) antiporter, partial [Ceratobasidium sp. 423]
ILFLFLIGLEIDPAVIRRNAKTSITVSAGGMILPFGIGAAVAVPIYNNFIDPEAASFNHFLLFVGVAFSITAFPVLCRILVALELLDTTVGVVVLSAGVCNDVVGWTLLALAIALVHASTGLTALSVFLYAVGWTLFIICPVKWSMIWLARRTGSVENGPSPLFMTTTILLVFGSALLTDIIGVHAIFGGFLAGLAIPHEGGLAIALTEKLEDMVSIIFLPLYFALSGMSTDLGLLNNSTTWGYTVLICVTAYVGKFSGGTLAAKFAGFTTRESATIGTLMSCKGLVELIVLNVGLSAGILSTRVFSMFVLEALVLTFATTPAALWLYPVKYRVRASTVGDNFGHASDDEISRSTSSTCSDGLLGWAGRRKFLFVFDKFESLPSAMMISRLLQVAPRSAESQPELAESKLLDLRTPESAEFAHLPVQEPPPHRHSITMDALRLLELTERTSAVMRSSEIDQLLTRDPLLKVFRTFAELEDIPVTSSLSIVSSENFVPSIMEHSIQNSSEMVVVSWTPTMGPAQDVHNPFDTLFKNSGAENTPSGIRSPFLRQLFAQFSVDVALFIERSTGIAHSLGGRSKQRLISVVGRGKRFALEPYREEIKEFGGGGEVGKTAGDIAAALFLNSVKGQVIVLQAAYTSRREE